MGLGAQRAAHAGSSHPIEQPPRLVALRPWSRVEGRYSVKGADEYPLSLLYGAEGAGGLQRSDDSASGAGQAVASHAERGPDAGYGNAGDAKTSLVDLSRGPCVELRHLQQDGGEAAQRLPGMRGQCKGKPTV